MTRVVFLIRSLGAGGAERQLTTLVRAMDKTHFEVTVITFYSGGYFEPALEESNIRLIGLRKRGRWDVVPFLWRLIGELRRVHPDVIHSYLVEPNLASVLVKPLVRSPKIVWGVRASNMDVSNYDWFVRMNFRLQALASRFADMIIFNSNAGRDHHLAYGFPPRRCTVIHGGVDTELFQPNRESGVPIRKEWGIRDDRILIGLVGRLHLAKDHPTFLKAAARLARENPALRFVCVGSGPERYATILRRLTDEHEIADRVIWAGERGDMPAVYNALDIVCSSSATEGWPNAIGEAMACGVTCVVTGAGDSAALVGETGIVVPPGDPHALAEGLKRGLKLVQSRQPPDTRARIAANFSLEQLVSRTEAALAAVQG